MGNGTITQDRVLNHLELLEDVSGFAHVSVLLKQHSGCFRYLMSFIDLLLFLEQWPFPSRKLLQLAIVVRNVRNTNSRSDV